MVIEQKFVDVRTDSLIESYFVICGFSCIICMSLVHLLELGIDDLLINTSAFSAAVLSLLAYFENKNAHCPIH